MKGIVYKRVLLKLSGEALQGERGYGLDPAILFRISKEIKEILSYNLQIAIITGGGNIFRGVDIKEFKQPVADYMGLLATGINSLALQGALEAIGVDTRLQTAIEMRDLAEPYIRRRAIRHLEKKRVVILAGGTGSPHFTTDTAAALRALEIEAEVILKATRVDGVYDSDPLLNPRARKYSQLTYLEVIEKGLKIMDTTAISLCMDNALPIVIFNLKKEGNIRRIIEGEKIGTIVSNGKD